jgi:hypothetical protein
MADDDREKNGRRSEGGCCWLEVFSLAYARLQSKRTTGEAQAAWRRLALCVCRLTLSAGSRQLSRRLSFVPLHAQGCSSDECAHSSSYLPQRWVFFCLEFRDDPLGQNLAQRHMREGNLMALLSPLVQATRALSTAG